MTAAVLLVLLSFVTNPVINSEKYWPQWRGPLATGVAPNANPPLEWSEEKNIRWKIEIPGKGSSSPIVWGDRVYVTTAIPAGKSAAPTSPESGDSRRRGIAATDVLQFVLLAISRRDGKIVWQRTAIEALPHEGTHPDGTWASTSPVTDGEHLIASFGSRGLFCYDMSGKLIWQKDLGDMSTRNSFGEGSSPVLHSNTLVVNWDHEGQSFIIALDKRTGKELWKADRRSRLRGRRRWLSPAGKPQVIVNATNRVQPCLSNGKLVWKIPTTPTPSAAGGGGRHGVCHRRLAARVIRDSICGRNGIPSNLGGWFGIRPRHAIRARRCL
jgi:hypothetical protein